MSSKDEMTCSEGAKNVIVDKKEIEKAVVASTGPNMERFNEAKYLSSQKKDIFYQSFHNIKERYQYKEQRMQNIQSRFEKISNELKLPVINKRISLPRASKK